MADRHRFRHLHLHRHRGQRRPVPVPLGRGLQRRVLHHRHARAQRVPYPAGTLLEDVGQLVTEELLPLGRLRIVLARAK